MVFLSPFRKPSACYHLFDVAKVQYKTIQSKCFVLKWFKFIHLRQSGGGRHFYFNKTIYLIKLMTCFSAICCVFIVESGHLVIWSFGHFHF